MADEEQYPARPAPEVVPQENDQADALPKGVQPVPELQRQQAPDDLEVQLCIFFTVNVIVLVCIVYVCIASLWLYLVYWDRFDI